MRPILLLGVAAAALAGCAGNSSGLRGAGAMRVEVEVYKGPLAQTVDIQKAELRAVLEETLGALMAYVHGAEEAAGRAATDGDAAGSGEDAPKSRCDRGGTDGCDRLKLTIQSSYEIGRDICALLGSRSERYDLFPKSGNHWIDTCEHIVSDGVSSAAQKEKARFNDVTVDPAFFAGASKIAASLKIKGLLIHHAGLGSVPTDPQIRNELADFMTLASEYSNQIQARAGVLAKQVELNKKANLLPVSDYLRDASATDFLNLYDWYEATTGDGPGPTRPKLNRVDRIRAAERLFSDYYWEKINEVHASGQGDVRMAFIKDDIGNWDLKTFANEPGRLLKAYTSAADAALQTAISLAGKGAPPLAAGRFVDLANRITTGETAAQPTLAGLDAGKLHARAEAKIKKAEARAAAAETELVKKKSEAEAAQETAEAALKATEASLATASADVTRLDQAYQQCLTANPTDASVCAAQKAALDAKVAERTRLEATRTEQAAEVAKQKEAVAAAGKAIVDLRKAAVEEIRGILDDHQTIIAAMQEAVAGGDGTVTAPGGGVTVPAAGGAGALTAARGALPSGLGR